MYIKVKEKKWLTDWGKSSICPIMAQILSIYGFVASVIISNNISEKMPIHMGFLQLAAGIASGLCGMAAGFAIGIVGDAGGKLVSHHHLSLSLFETDIPPPPLKSAQVRNSPVCISA